MTGNERLAAVLRILPAWVVASDERLVSHDESDIMRIVADELAVVFPTGEPDDLGLGAGTVFYVLYVGLSCAAQKAGMTRAELAVGVAQRIAVLNFGSEIRE